MAQRDDLSIIMKLSELPQAVVERTEGDMLTEAYSSVESDEYVRELVSMASSSQSLEYISVGLSEEQIKVAIEKSREQGWSELKDMTEVVVAESPSAQATLIWEELKKMDSNLFKDDVEVKLGQLIAEGGQAHIYEAQIKLVNCTRPLFFDDQWVAKVFKMEGFSLANLQRHWPLATKAGAKAKRAKIWKEVVMGGVAFDEYMDYCNRIWCGTFLKDGRFAFVMHRYWGDLRTLIDTRLSHCNNSQGPPFSHDVAVKIMRDIAKGMRGLHARGMLHRDLRAANVLITSFDDSLGALNEDEITNLEFRTIVADFESSILVQGTRFWRAPEVLEELFDKESDQNGIEIWTRKADTYNYAMTCYEVLTGHVPFAKYLMNDWKRIVDGERPHLPEYIDDELGEIVKRCWHKVPSERPSFKVIIRELDIHMQVKVDDI